MAVVNMDLLNQLLDEVLSEYPYEKSNGLDENIVRNLMIPQVVQQLEGMQDMNAEQQVAVLSACIVKLTIDNFILNYKLMRNA
jgi:hypothetical protein